MLAALRRWAGALMRGRKPETPQMPQDAPKPAAAIPVAEALPEPPPAPPAAQVRGLQDKAAFFAHLRGRIKPRLSAGQVAGCETVAQACEGLPLAWAAYAMATAWHETAFTMQPIKEHGGEAYFTRLYDIKGERPEVAKRLGNVWPGDGARFCGRGYVQLTGRRNYDKAASMLGVDLIADPDLAMRPDLAAAILRLGMSRGWFTGRGFKDYLPPVATEAQFVQARRIINGSDKAEAIARYAAIFQGALLAGGWA